MNRVITTIGEITTMKEITTVTTRAERNQSGAKLPWGKNTMRENYQG